MQIIAVSRTSVLDAVEGCRVLDIIVFGARVGAREGVLQILESRRILKVASIVLNDEIVREHFERVVEALATMIAAPVRRLLFRLGWHHQVHTWRGQVLDIELMRYRCFGNIVKQVPCGANHGYCANDVILGVKVDAFAECDPRRC